MVVFTNLLCLVGSLGAFVQIIQLFIGQLDVECWSLVCGTFFLSEGLGKACLCIQLLLARFVALLKLWYV